MLQILTYLLSFYLVIKGVEICRLLLLPAVQKDGIIILAACSRRLPRGCNWFLVHADRQAMPTAEAPLRSSDDSGYVMFTCIPRDGPCFDDQADR